MADAPAPNKSPLSLQRITDALSAMLSRPLRARETGDPAGPQATTPRAILEAALFVGRPDGRPLSAAELSAVLRDVSVEEVRTELTQLNAIYEAEGAALAIETSAAGYRLVLRSELDGVRRQFAGRVRQSSLSPAAIEVLSIVAYRQPVTAEQIDQFRPGKNRTLLAQLVRRGLLRLERPVDGESVYRTTDRLLHLLGIASIEQLPRAEEFDLPAIPQAG